MRVPRFISGKYDTKVKNYFCFKFNVNGAREQKKNQKLNKISRFLSETHVIIKQKCEKNQK